MDSPLQIISLLQFAARYHGDSEIVSRTVEGPIHRYTYRDAYARSGRLANALKRLGVVEGDRIATVAWNGYRHFELYFGISGMGAVLHTINPRLPPDQFGYIVNHAEDRFIFLDLTFVPLLEAMAPALEGVAGYVIMTDAAHMPETKLANAMCYETLLEAESDSFDWPALDENAASSLCYTSGTTGKPKGALYSHRTTLLHTLGVNSAEGLATTSHDTVLPAVPMFHVNAWGIPYACAMTGAKLVLPGAGYAGDAMYEMLDSEAVTMSAGVPTIWFMLLEYLRTAGKTLTHLESVIVGGSAAPLSMIRAFEEDHEVTVFHAWGMTEMSPVGTFGRLNKRMLALPKEEQWKQKLKQGRAFYGVDLKIVDDDGNELPHDGEAFGELLVRGPWIIGGYYNDPEATAAAFDDAGWFRTGDVAKIDTEGYMQIVDRSKDVIKSGGEWISSIDLENVAVGHPGVAEAAVIGVAHAKWGERPLLIILPTQDAKPSAKEILDYLNGKVANWWLPDDVAFVDELPHTATGKVSKLTLRQQFKDYQLPEA